MNTDVGIAASRVHVRTSTEGQGAAETLRRRAAPERAAGPVSLEPLFRTTDKYRRAVPLLAPEELVG